ncbi:MAG: NAD(P)-dependent oxidoreductase [Nanoarchaeota archaeon]|nr:NAD(P)-dependent oxidoreductase [Nanoarchaeota archaeon]
MDIKNNNNNSKNRKSIGWIGTGVMGESMCKYVMNQENSGIYVYNRTKSKAQNLLDKDAIWCENPQEVAQRADIIFTIIGYPKDVEEIYLSENGLINSAKEGTILVDMTTSSPTLAKEIYDKGQEREILVLDAPVTGGDIGAKNGTLVIMVGGDEKVFEEVKPYFDEMGSIVSFMGKAGLGQHTKLANQIGIAGSIIGTCEALLYATKTGINLEQFIETIKGGSAGSWQLTNMAPRIIQENFEPGFYIKHFIKDMKLALDECEKMNITLQGLELVHSIYSKVKDTDLENLGTQGLYKILKEM